MPLRAAFRRQRSTYSSWISATCAVLHLSLPKSKRAKQEYQAKKYVSKEEKKIRNRISFLEKGIESIEQKMAEIEAVLANPGPEDDVIELTRAYLENKRELDYKMEEWEKLNESLE